MSVVNVDIAIVGAGIAGQTLALALAQDDFAVAVIDANKISQSISDEFSPRVSAISKTSERIFKNVNAWQHIHRMQAYTDMQVWEDQAFGRIAFSAQENKLESLGHIIENNCITQALFETAKDQENIQFFSGEKIANINRSDEQQFINLENGDMIAAKLIVGADGGNSFVRKTAKFALTFWDYDHIAIVANIETERPHELVARQAFTPTGPLAFLPLSTPKACSIVWSQDTQEAERLLGLSDEEFCKSLQVALDNQLGKCDLLSKRFSYPLKMQYAQQWVDNGIVLVGDAAHTIHPLAGQGANLGLLDVATLAQELATLKQAEKAFHTKKALRPYERWRKAEAAKMIATMEGFKRLFSGKDPALKLARNLGLATANTLPPIKSFFIEQAMGSAGKLPELARSTIKK
ncbi:FAD-dependent monooxygenase [Glaciecola sp. MF2-115]|uniref:FAD-dependent monooxygenase n=1 Tax=Glaciecola sp. MF2-115 TaxID=3384827 RepID=UPI00399F082D